MARIEGKSSRQDGAQLDDQPLARRLVIGHHQKLGEVRIAQLLVERQEEARRALADIGGDEALVLVVHHLGFERLGLRLDLLDAGAFRQPEIDEDFRPRRLREEVLRDELERPQAGGEGHQRHHQHDDAMAHRPADRGAKPAVEACVEGIVMTAGMLALLEDHVAEPRREIDRDEPRHDQRDADDIEQRAHIFAGGRGGEADRDEAGGGDQRAGQHREGGRGIGEARRLDLDQPLLQLSLHHLDDDHGVVDQQAERDDQRAERDALQVDAELVHDGEGGGQHQRNGDGDDQAGTPADRQERDDKHDQQRFAERLHELVDGILDDLRLVGNLVDRNAIGQRFLEALVGRLDILADIGDVEALGHDDAELDAFVAVEAVFALIGIFETGGHGGDVAEPRHLAAGAQAQFPDVGSLGDVAFDRDAHRAQAGVDGARRIDIVLALDRVLQVGQRQAALGKRLGRDVDIELLRLVADDDGLLDARRRQQHVARLDGEFLQLGIAVAVAADRMQRDEGVAELVVEIGAEQALRQVARDVADLLAHLVEGVLHLLGIGVALDLHGDDGAAGAGVGADEIEMRRFLQLALDLVDDLVLHLLDRGARPDRLDDHDAEGEIGVFLLAHAHQAERAGNDDQAEQEARDARDGRWPSAKD